MIIARKKIAKNLNPSVEQRVQTIRYLEELKERQNKTIKSKKWK
jgi:hypothetical protein